jgi:hypothetical protein
MEEVQNNIDGAQGFLGGVQSAWDGFTGFVGKIPGINGSLEDIVGGLLLAGITAVAGFIVYGIVNG